MAMLFISGFGTDSNPATDFDGVGAANQGFNDLTGTISRTGKGCYVTQGVFGPFKTLPANKSSLIVGIAVNCTTVPAGFPFVWFWQGVSGQAQLQVQINSNGSLSVLRGTTVLGTTATGLVFTGVYFYVELQATISTVTGSFTLRINGATVLSQSGINTDAAGSGFVDTVQVRGVGGGLTMLMADFYIFDTLGAVNNSFAGPVRVFTALPTSDNAPLQWTPSTGMVHFSLVNGVPAESQTTYVSDATVGNTDQYLYNVSAIPASVTILGVQHGMQALLDSAGTGSLGSSCGGIVAGSVALTTSPHIYSFPRDTDPVAAGAWTLTNLTNRQFGPNRTA